jgi:hypothetical protein
MVPDLLAALSRNRVVLQRRGAWDGMGANIETADALIPAAAAPAADVHHPHDRHGCCSNRCARRQSSRGYQCLQPKAPTPAIWQSWTCRPSAQSFTRINGRASLAPRCCRHRSIPAPSAYCHSGCCRHADLPQGPAWLINKGFHHLSL